MYSSKCTEHYTDTSMTPKEVMRTVSNIYHDRVPDKIKNQKNTDQLKQHDTMIIACVIWGIVNGYINQRAAHRAVCSVLSPNGDFPSRSRSTHLSSNLAYTIKIIRYFFIKKLTKSELVEIIDNFPSPLCEPVRDGQIELLNQITKVGYDLTKESYFYGPKIHMIVTKTDSPVTYSIMNPGVHDVKVLETLSEEADLPNILGDKGHTSHKIHERLAFRSITISVPSHKNINKSEELDHSLPRRQRKTIKTVFSLLEELGCQNFNPRSVRGLKSRFESILLAHSILLSRAQRRLKGTLRCSLGYQN